MPEAIVPAGESAVMYYTRAKLINAVCVERNLLHPYHWFRRGTPCAISTVGGFVLNAVGSVSCLGGEPVQDVEHRCTTPRHIRVHCMMPLLFLLVPFLVVRIVMEQDSLVAITKCLDLVRLENPPGEVQTLVPEHRRVESAKFQKGLAVPCGKPFRAGRCVPAVWSQVVMRTR